MTVTVSDSFEFREGLVGSKHPQGLVAVFDAASLPGKLPGVGVTVSIHRADGASIERKIDEVKELGKGVVSYFFAGLHRHEVPVGSQITWPDDIRQWRRGAATVGALGQGS